MGKLNWAKVISAGSFIPLRVLKQVDDLQGILDLLASKNVRLFGGDNAYQFKSSEGKRVKIAGKATERDIGTYLVDNLGTVEAVNEEIEQARK